MLAEDVFESEDLQLLSEEEVMEINGGCGSVGPGPSNDSERSLGRKVSEAAADGYVTGGPIGAAGSVAMELGCHYLCD